MQFLQIFACHLFAKNDKYLNSDGNLRYIRASEKMKRTLISLCCLLLAAVYPTAMVVEIIGIRIQRSEFKKAFRNSQLDLTKAEVIFLSEDEFEGQKPGEEFELGEYKYDVVKVNKAQNGYWITAFNDTLEKQLEIQLAENCKSNGGHPSKTKKSLFKIHMICEPIKDFEISQNLIGQIINGHLFEEHKGFIRMPIQPPRFLS